MAAEELVRLILFSGMAADASVFAPQRLAFPELIVPEWPIPNHTDTLSTYCGRLASPLRSSSPCVIGGASFGGIVALEIARYLNPAAVILIGSVREPSQLPKRVRMFRPFAGTTKWLPIRCLQWSAAPFASNAARRIMPHLGELARQFRDANDIVLRWSVRQVLTWDRRPTVGCPIYHIHGQRDHVLPVSRTQPDAIIKGGGHVISMTNAAEVNAFVRLCVDRIPFEKGPDLGLHSANQARHSPPGRI